MCVEGVTIGCWKKVPEPDYERYEDISRGRGETPPVNGECGVLGMRGRTRMPMITLPYIMG